MRVALGSDHGGYGLKQEVIKYLEEKGIEYRDFGCMSTQSCDYPEFGSAAAKAVAAGDCGNPLCALFGHRVCQIDEGT